MRKTLFGVIGVACLTAAACAHPAVRTAPTTANGKASPAAATGGTQYVIDGGKAGRPVEPQNALYVVDGVLLTEALATANQSERAPGANNTPGYFIDGVPLAEPAPTVNKPEGAGGAKDAPGYVIDGVPLDIPGSAGAAPTSAPATRTPQQ